MGFEQSAITVGILLFIGLIIYSKVQKQTLGDTLKELIGVFRSPAENIDVRRTVN